MNDYEQTSVDTAFVVNFGPDCTADEISYGAVIADPQEYLITTPATPLPITPSVTQLVPNCPIICTLT